MTPISCGQYTKADARNDLYARYTWLYGDPAAREAANTPDLMAWAHLGKPGLVIEPPPPLFHPDSHPAPSPLRKAQTTAFPQQ